MKIAHWLCKCGLLLSWGLVLIAAGGETRYALADPANGKKLFEAKQCGACHATSGPVKMLPVTERSKIKGPPLWFVGSKFQPEWLISWLAAPTPIRRVKYGGLTKGGDKHPALSGADAKTVGDYLLSLTDSTMKSGAVKSKKLKRRTRIKAEKLFVKKQVCFGCHEYPSKKGNIGGFAGPSLVGAGKRLRADWVYAFMNDPSRYYPNARMPVYGDQAFNLFTEKELKLLAQYIGNL